MTAERHVQLTMLPDYAPDQVRGWVMQSVFTGSNADLIAAIAPMYLHGTRILDPTYGEGHMWRRYRPATLTTHDLKHDRVDFRNLPYPDRHFDAIVFDPPYVPRSGRPRPFAVPHIARFCERYGIAERSTRQLLDLVCAGLTETARTLRPGGFLLVKCNDFTANRKLHLGHRYVVDYAELIGLGCHDLIVHHAGMGPGSGPEHPTRSRRAHSYLVVLRKPRLRGKIRPHRLEAGQPRWTTPEATRDGSDPTSEHGGDR